MKTERRPANEAQVGREWVDLAVYQQKVKELQSTIRQRLHEQVDPQQFGRIGECRPTLDRQASEYWLFTLFGSQRGPITV